MITINKSALIGKGHHREVYRHPNDPNLCIKIIFDTNYDSREIQRELNYYKHLEKKGATWEMLPRYHGDIETNLGTGSVFDMILDFDGSISRSLGHYLNSNEKTTTYFDDLLISLSMLKSYLLKNKVVTKSLAHRNIVCQKSESGIGRLVLIDNIGNTEFLPISNHVGFMARKKIMRKWRRFEYKLLSEFPDNQGLFKIIKRLSQA